MLKDKKYYILYRTTNKVNEKYYIGIHCTNDLDDGYLGSGSLLRKAIKKYGRNNFVRAILLFASSYEELLIIEKEIVNEDFVSLKETYNRDIGGSGGKIWTEDMKLKMSETKKGCKGWNKGLKGANRWSEDSKKKKSIAMTGKNNPMYGINVADLLSEEENNNRLEKISNSLRGKIRSDKHKENYSKAASQRIWIVHMSGKISHTMDLNDSRLNDPHWQRGMKWKE